MDNKFKIMLVEDKDIDALLIVKHLKLAGYEVEYKQVFNKHQIISCLSDNYDIIITDYYNQGFTGVDVIEWIKPISDIPILMISGVLDETHIVNAVRQGAKDFISKDNLKRLVPAIEREVAEYKKFKEFQKKLENANNIKTELEKALQLQNMALQTALKQLQSEIEEKESTQKNLSHTQKFLDIILESLPDTVYMKNAIDLKYSYINKAGEILTGHNRAEIIGASSYDLFTKDLADEFSISDQDIIHGKISYYVSEELLHDKNGNIKNVLANKIPIFGKNGEIEYILGIYRDITEQRIAENEYQKSELQFETIFQSSPIAILIERAADSVIIDLNPKVSEFLGKESQEYLGFRFDQLPIWESDEALQKYRNDILANDSVTNRELILKTQKGEHRTILISGVKISLNDESLIIHMGFDISATITAYHETKSALKKQKELNLLKNTFISMISHEFRTPLTTIMLSNDLLKRHSADWDEETRAKHFNRIQETVLKMTKLMENVLIIGRIETGKFSVTLENLDIDKICAGLAENIMFSNSNSHNIIYNGNLKYTKKDFLFDENLIALTLNNLLSNAVKYSPKGSSIHFDVNYFEENEQIEFRVKDEGIGIPEDDLRRLFDSFFRAKNVGPIDGYGLGLSIVKKCVDTQNGGIELYSTVGEGTEFVIKLPTNLSVEQFAVDVEF